MPEKTTIIGSIKLTGKTKDGLSIGILESITKEETAEIDLLGKRYSTIVEPLTNYFMGRIQKDYDKGNTIIGGALTAVNRKIKDDKLKFLSDASYSGGIDFKHNWSEKKYYITGNALFSYVVGDKMALSRIQLSPTHYFQRPDADYLDYDINRTSLSGYGGLIEIGKSGGGQWRFSETIKMFSPGFEVNDIGYLPMSDRIYQSSRIGYVIQTPSGILRNYSVFLNQNSSWNFGGDKLDFSVGIVPSFTSINNWKFNFEILRKNSSISPFLIWGGPSFKLDGNWSLLYSISSDYTKAIEMEITFNNKMFDDKISSYFSTNYSCSFRLSNSFIFSCDLLFDNTKENLQYLDTKSIDAKEYYFLGFVDQKTMRLTFRASYNITPDLSIQYYASPFFAARKYSEIKKVLNPRADNYNDRFYKYNDKEIKFDKTSNSFLIDDNNDGKNEFILNNPDMSFKELHSNLVLKWEYNPGSTIYFVWSQGRIESENYRSMVFNRDMEQLYNVYPDNIFIIKINHWFSL
jgi:hypothetical protein